MKKLIFSIIIILGLNSCKENAQEQNAEIVNRIDSLQNPKEIDSLEKPNNFRDTLQINYLGHKDLLEILKILPDSTMGSWGWKPNDRKEFVDFIEKNNFTVDTTEQYQNIKKIKPNTIGIQVVDGYWTLSIYKIKPKNYIVITNDIVGDGGDVKTFEYNNGELKSKNIDLFRSFSSQILNNKNDSKCLELLEDEKILFEYNLDDESEIIIKNPSLSNENEYKNCFKGNTLHYKLNLKSMNFDLIKIDWEK